MANTPSPTVAYDYITPDGVIQPDTENIQNDVINEYQNVFGSDLIVTPDTPQGMLIVTETLARVSLAQNNSVLANQINPNLAGGTFLDAICALTGFARTLATKSTVVGSLTGVPGTLISAGSQAQENINFNTFETLNDVTLGTDGTATVTFQALLDGPIDAEPGSLTIIVSTVLGWETVTNAASAILGQNEQSDVSLRNLRKQTLAIQGQGLPEAILSGLYATQGVTSATFLENPMSTTQTVHGVSMVRNSIYVCVAGGADVDVATTLAMKKNGGCAYNNGPGINIMYSLTIPFSGQVQTILFDRPNLIRILVRATVFTTDTLSDPISAVQNSIIAYATGQIPSVPGLTVGTDVSCFAISAGVNYFYPTIFIDNMEISLSSSISYTNTTIDINVFEQATIAIGDIIVNVITP